MLAAILNPRGFAVAGVAIRSSAHVRFPGQLHDIKGRDPVVAGERRAAANPVTYVDRRPERSGDDGPLDRAPSWDLVAAWLDRRLRPGHRER